MTSYFLSFLRACIALPVLIMVGCGGGNANPAGDTAGAIPNAPAPPSVPEPSSAPSGPPPDGSSAGEPTWVGQSADEPFDVKQFLAGRSEPADNAAPHYMAAFAAFDGNLGGEDARALEERIRTLANLNALAAGNTNRDEIKDVLDKTAAARKQIDAAQAKPSCIFMTELGVDANLPHALPARTVARLSLLEMQQAKESGDFALAENAIRRGLKMSRDLRPRGPAVCQLVSIAIDGMLLGGIESLVLGNPKLTPQQCEQLLALLIEHEKSGINCQQEALKMEYILMRTTLGNLQSGKLTYERLLEVIGANMFGKVATPQVQLSQLPASHFEVEAAACNRVFAEALKDAQNPATAGARIGAGAAAKLMEDTKALMANPDPNRVLQIPFLTVLLTAPLQTFGDADFRARAHLAGAQMLTALKRYQLAHGQSPEAIDAAAAETALKTVPIDPYSGEPLKYAVVNNRPIIYSIGKDLQDDGGQKDWKLSTQPGDFLFVLASPPAAKTTSRSPPPKTSQSKPSAKTASPSVASKVQPTTKPAPESSATTAAAATEPEIRTWTSTAGTTIEAELKGVEGKTAVLKKRDGAEIRVSLSKLSNFDQQWIKNNAP